MQQKPDTPSDRFDSGFLARGRQHEANRCPSHTLSKVDLPAGVNEVVELVNTTAQAAVADDRDDQDRRWQAQYKSKQMRRSQIKAWSPSAREISESFHTPVRALRRAYQRVRRSSG